VQFAQAWTASEERFDGTAGSRRKDPESFGEERLSRESAGTIVEKTWRAVPKDCPDFREAKAFAASKIRAPGWVGR